MPIFTVVNPDIPAESKDKFLAAWPTLNAELKSQPGVAGVLAGRIVFEDGKQVDEFKWAETLAFKTAEDFEAFANSDWSKEQKAKYVAARGEDPKVGRFEVADFPVGATGPTPFIQFSTLLLDDESKGEEAKKAWLELTTALGGKESWGGKSIGDGPTVGLALVGWDSLDEIIAAFQKPEAVAALAAYKALGKSRNVVVKVE